MWLENRPIDNRWNIMSSCKEFCKMYRISNNRLSNNNSKGGKI